MDASNEVGRLAPSRATVLIVGGSRALQATVARALHERSSRSAAPFVTVDCEEVLAIDLEAVLFGGPVYVQDGRGAIHDADSGTLYVAAVHALPLALQPRFLGYLDARLSSQGRVVVSTDIELDDRVDAGVFRRDLADRLDLVRVALDPPASRRGPPR